MLLAICRMRQSAKCLTHQAIYKICNLLTDCLATQALCILPEISDQAVYISPIFIKNLFSNFFCIKEFERVGLFEKLATHFMLNSRTNLIKVARYQCGRITFLTYCGLPVFAAIKTGSCFINRCMQSLIICIIFFSSFTAPAYYSISNLRLHTIAISKLAGNASTVLSQIWGPSSGSARTASINRQFIDFVKIRYFAGCVRHFAHCQIRQIASNIYCT